MALNNDDRERQARQATTLFRDTAETFFAELADAIGHEGDDLRQAVGRRYAVLRRVLTEAAEQQTEDVPLVFVGLLARIDYLVRLRHIPRDVMLSISSTRHALFSPRSNMRRMTTEQLAEAWPYHLEAVCRFVSLLYNDAPIPASLSAAFPLKAIEHQWARPDMRRLRLVVNSWTGDVITCRLADSALEVTVVYGKSNEYLTQHGQMDWSYLKDLLREGSLINIINVRARGNQLLPELIIVEPDHLVDVSTITACMETYGDTPLAAIVNRLKPQQNTSAILLGNLVGQFLDETIHGEHHSYAESLGNFFRHNAIALATADELSDAEKAAEFHEQAKRQQQQIAALMGRDLPAAVAEYDSTQSLTEPSFFCETLGLQGRMDLLQQNVNMIVEQKSGKGEWVLMGALGYSQEVPKPRQPHYAQLLLYRAMLQYGLGQTAGSLGNIFLLYSRYPKGLLRLGSAPALLHRAIRLRNQIACQERILAEEGWDILRTLTPERLNVNGTDSTLWRQYTRPELERLLAPVQAASPLEQAYALRMLRFVSLEQMLARIGTGSQHPGFSGKWRLSLEEKRAAGDILDSLRISTLHKEGRNVTEVVLVAIDAIVAIDSIDAIAPATNFRRGDVVVMYSYEQGREPDVCAQMVMRGTIAALRQDGVTIRLRNAQTDARVFDVPDGYLWAVEHDLYESSAGALYRGLHTFLTAPIERRQLLMMQRPPHVDGSLKLRGDYGAFNNLVLRARQSREVFLVIGPPGTGKTSFALMNILREELLEEGTSVLLTAFTNRAVDEICDKLDEAGIDYLRLGSELSCSEQCRPHLLERRVADCRNVREVRQMLCRARVVCSTTASMCGSGLSLLGIRRFSLAIIDEASQLLEPHLLPLLCATTQDGEAAIGRFVMIGDHKQLPAVVQQTTAQSRVEEPILHEIGLTDCRRSLFERWLTGWRQAPEHVYMLTRQGRMHRDIAIFPSRFFYGGRLEVASERQTAVIEQPRMLFINAPLPQHSPSDKVNSVEAAIAADIVVDTWQRYGKAFDADRTVGVIVPYRSQISAVRQAIATKADSTLTTPHSSPSNITIDTVERFQGSQRDVIVYCFTVQQRHQLSFLTSSVLEEQGQVIDRKLNVAMTRARERLVLIGHAPLLEENITFARLINYLKEQGAYKEIKKTANSIVIV